VKESLVKLSEFPKKLTELKVKEHETQIAHPAPIPTTVARNRCEHPRANGGAR
jgi:hypothetical protein